MARLAAFVSPHGFGHAARTAAVLAALGRRLPRVEVEIWTTVPRWFFEESLDFPFEHVEFASDVGLAQRSALEEDPEATAAALARLAPSEADLARHAAELRRRGVGLVLCDISPWGLEIAARAGLPAALLENFTWDWIYGEYAAEVPALGEQAARMARAFASATLRFRAEPACGEAPGVAVGPIARRPRSTPAAVRERLAIPDGAALVLVTLGGIPWRFDGFAGWRARDAVFVVPGGAEHEHHEEGLRLLPHHTPLFHPDLVAAADLVVGKLGYSTVAEAVAAGTRFAYLARPRFRESAVLARFVQHHLPSRELPLPDFQSGRWTVHLPALLAQPRPAPHPADGAETVAQHLAAALDRPTRPGETGGQELSRSSQRLEGGSHEG